MVAVTVFQKVLHVPIYWSLHTGHVKRWGTLHGCCEHLHVTDIKSSRDSGKMVESSSLFRIEGLSTKGFNLFLVCLDWFD